MLTVGSGDHQPARTPQPQRLRFSDSPPRCTENLDFAHYIAGRCSSAKRLVGPDKIGNAARRGTSSGPADANMEQRRRPEYNLEIFADLACVKDVVKGESTLLPCVTS